MIRLGSLDSPLCLTVTSGAKLDHGIVADGYGMNGFTDVVREESAAQQRRSKVAPWTSRSREPEEFKEENDRRKGEKNALLQQLERE